jgi:predicted nucleic-acid-binding Zn-ribbon protein
MSWTKWNSPPTNDVKQVKETKCTCNSCGNVWYYGKQEVQENKAAALSNVGKAMMCCGGCIPAVLIPNKKAVDLDKCPKCGSRAITKEEVTHEV